MFSRPGQAKHFGQSWPTLLKAIRHFSSEWPSKLAVVMSLMSVRGEWPTGLARYESTALPSIIQALETNDRQNVVSPDDYGHS